MADPGVDGGHRRRSAAQSGVIVGATADLPNRIADPRVSLVVREPTMPAAVAAWLDAVPNSGLHPSPLFWRRGAAVHRL